MKNHRIFSFFIEQVCRHRLMVRTLDFHSRNGGSIPPGDTKQRTKQILLRQDFFVLKSFWIYTVFDEF